MDPAAGPDAPYSIGDLAERCGISADTLRVWERRYGRPKARRLPSGHRRYDEADLRWLRRMAEGLARGHRPSSLVDFGESDWEGILAPATASPTDGWIETRFGELRRFDAAALEEALRSEWRRLGTFRWLLDRVEPLLVETGRRWADGGIEVRHEHFLSELLEGLLRGRRAGRAAGAPLLLLAGLPGERHSLGLQIAAAVVRDAGGASAILGVDSPLEEIARAARETEADAVGIGVSLANGGIAGDRRLAALRRLLPGQVRLAAGGGGVRGPGRGPRGVEFLPSLRELREFVRALHPPFRRGASGALP